MTIDSSVTKKNVPMAASLFAGLSVTVLCLGVGGVVFFFIPFIGWIAGPFIVFIGFKTVMGSNVQYTSNCPYCGLNIRLAARPGKVGRCTNCRKDYVHRDGCLLKIA